jgi:GR25 family glycosyltransferase involved in LPS biosynthesis
MRLDEFFDHIYCINLDRREDRWQESLEEFLKNDIKDVERFSATDGTLIPRDGYPGNMKSGDIGSLLTHQRIFADAIENDYNNFLLVEDDVQFIENFSNLFSEAINDLPEDWQIFYLGGNHNLGSPSPITERIALANRTLATHSISFKKEIYFDVLNLLNSNEPNDVTYANNLYRFKSFVCYPPLSWQRPSWSDVENTYADHVHLRNY